MFLDTDSYYVLRSVLWTLQFCGMPLGTPEGGTLFSVLQKITLSYSFLTDLFLGAVPGPWGKSSPPQDELIFPALVIVVTESHDSVLAKGLSEKVCWAEAQKSNKPLKKRALLTPLKSLKSLWCMELLQPFYNQKVKKKKKSADYSGKDISSQPAEAALRVASRLPVK